MIPFLKRLIHLTQKSKYSPINRIINDEELERQQEKKRAAAEWDRAEQGRNKKEIVLTPHRIILHLPKEEDKNDSHGELTRRTPFMFCSLQRYLYW